VTVTFGTTEGPRRRRSLDTIGVLETPAEERYDRITRLARLTFDVMLSTITLVDHERAWIKSIAGGERSESPLDDSFCAHTLLADSPVVVSDVTLDERFAELPAVTGTLGIRFYAGFPVHDRHGIAIGTLCLYDSRPRILDDAGLAVMADLTAWVEAELVAPAVPERTLRLNGGPVPHSAPDIPGYDTAVFCHSARGDAVGALYDHQRQGDVHAFAVADLVGTGTGGARFMATAKEVLQAQNRSLASGGLARPGTLADVLTALNDRLLDGLSSNTSFMTGFFGWADPVTGTIRYVDAGHGLGVVVRADGTAEPLRTIDLALGVTDDWRWTEQQVVLEPGDDLVCFNRGLVTLLGGLRHAVPAIAQLVEDADDPRRVVNLVRRLAAEGLPTDVTVLAVRRTAA
jgi:sigma-B regulation protein RsbU (phosphoserine phosphatase)